jgi:Ca2+-binding EF-hand superfamily protein
MNIKKSAVILALAVVTAVPVMAKGKNKGNDDNRVITRSEWKRDAASFDRLDTNRDGVLSGTELKAKRSGSKSKGGFKGMDTNRDGIVSRSEWRGNDNSFRQHDTNNDGVLSNTELRKNKNKN